jgi:hypothetical protein
MPGDYGLYIGKVTLFLQPATAVGRPVFGQQQIEHSVTFITS